MAEALSISAEPRERVGKGAARQARRAGRIPGVIYGSDEPTVHISMDATFLEQEARKPAFFATLYDLTINGATQRVLARELQLHPVKDNPIHVDFLRVSSDTMIHVDIQVVFENEEESPGLRRGGVLNIVRHEIELVCRADHIPPSLSADLTGLDIGDGVHIGDIELPEGVRPAIEDRDFTVATIAAPTVMVEEEEVEEEELEEGEEALEEAEGEAEAEGKPEESEGS